VSSADAVRVSAARRLNRHKLTTFMAPPKKFHFTQINLARKFVKGKVPGSPFLFATANRL
jgi:hypothetical protein